SMSGLTREDFMNQEKMAELRKKNQEDTAKFMKETLNEEQSKRLNQISLQQSLKNNPAGAFYTINFSRDGITFGDPTETGKALKLTDEQKDKIKSINEQYSKDMRELRGGGGGGRPMRPDPDTQKKIDALRKETGEKIMDVLTEDQKKALNELKGEEF